MISCWTPVNDDFILTCLAESIGCFWWPFWSAKRQCLWPSLYSRSCWPDRWISPKLGSLPFSARRATISPWATRSVSLDTLPLPYLFNTMQQSAVWLNGWCDVITKKHGRMNRGFRPALGAFTQAKRALGCSIIRHFHFIFPSSLSLRFLASLVFVHLLVFCAVHFHWMANNPTILGKLRLSHADVAGTFCSTNITVIMKSSDVQFVLFYYVDLFSFPLNLWR